MEKALCPISRQKMDSTKSDGDENLKHNGVSTIQGSWRLTILLTLQDYEISLCSDGQVVAPNLQNHQRTVGGKSILN
jgi:hypothetical protein